MHEYPITKQIIEIATKHCLQNNAKKVYEISLVVGEYCGFVATSIEMYFEQISQNTPCEGAILIVEHIKPKLRCLGCGELFERKMYFFSCPYCSCEGQPSEIGKEFFVKEIKIGE